MKISTKISIVAIITTFGIAIYEYEFFKSFFNMDPLELEPVSLLPPLYIITPTYPRGEQIAEITRMGNTLRNVPNLFWLVIEDAHVKTPQLTRQLHRIGVPFEHLIAPMPKEFKNVKLIRKPRGVSNRNRGLTWLRDNVVDGVFYFADDDNSYDLELFEQMRTVQKVAFFPVGLIQDFGLSTPILENGTFYGNYYEANPGHRKYKLDMAGFAVSVKFLLSRPNAKMPFRVGGEEDGFLKSLEPFNYDEIEFLANNCTQVLVWHTKTFKYPPVTPIDKVKYSGTNLVKLYDDNYETTTISNQINRTDRNDEILPSF